MPLGCILTGGTSFSKLGFLIPNAPGREHHVATFRVVGAEAPIVQRVTQVQNGEAS